MIEGTKIFAVPLYQRRYSWNQSNWRSYWRSILDQYDAIKNGDGTQLAPTHFIGSFVLAPAPGAASAPTRFVVVDGQQRLTTSMILLAAIRDCLAEDAQSEEERQAAVAKYNTLYLTNPFETAPEKRMRVLPTQQDRENYQECVGRTPAVPNGLIGEAYEYFKSARCLRGKDLQEENLNLGLIAEVLLTRFSLVEITTESGDNVHKIFQTLNSAGVKLKQVDLLRNHFFMLLPTKGERLYGELWRQMELDLGERQLDHFFWAELVRLNAKVSRTDVYAAMQLALEPIESDESAVERRLRDFYEDSSLYLSIIESGERVPGGIEQRLAFLRQWGSDTARPLILECLVRWRDGRLSESDTELCLETIESFLVRRMLVGIPTNNLNRIFSSLTPTLARGDFSASDVVNAFSEGKKYWPSDAQVVDALGVRPFYFSGQAHQRRMVLEALEIELAGKEGSILDDQVTIEHVLPQVASPEWLASLDHDPMVASQKHDRFVHTIGNLTLTGYNSELGNRSYAEKRDLYRKSQLALTREIADAYEGWTTESIRQRSETLAGRANVRWPGPPSSDIDLRALTMADVEEALIVMPSTAWTSVADLAELSGLGQVDLQDELDAFPDSIRAKVREEQETTQTQAGHYTADKLRAVIQKSVEGED